MKYVNLVFIACSVALAACGGGGDAAPAAATSLNAPIVTSTPTQVSQSTPSAPMGGVADTALSQANTCNLPNYQADMLRAINDARAQARTCGPAAKPAVASISWNSELFTAAALHSQDMAQREYFAHINPEGITPGERANLAGYGYSNLGENIAAGQTSIAQVMQGWLDSKDHCNAIMNGAYTEVAVACVSTTRFKYPSYWTMELGRPA